MRKSASLLAYVVAALGIATPASPQGSTHTVAPVCIACRNAIGLRFNIRDRDLESVTGVNLTLWSPRRPTTGTVNGVALGVLATGASYLNGISIAPIALNAANRLEGIGVSGLLFGVGGEAKGLIVAGLGGGISEGLTGISITGFAVGIGGDADGIILAGVGGNVAGGFRGVAISSIGFGIGGSGYGILVGGAGAAVSGTMRGVSLAGVGFGGSGSIEGLMVAGMAAGVGGDLRGISIAGLAMGVQGTASGITIAPLGLGIKHLEVFAASTVVVTQDAHAVVLAPLFFAARDDAAGLFVSTLNKVGGKQTGLSIGLINYAKSLRGLQVGLLNIVDDGKGPKILPIANYR